MDSRVPLLGTTRSPADDDTDVTASRVIPAFTG
jgi:hypothetical protein